MDAMETRTGQQTEQVEAGTKEEVQTDNLSDEAKLAAEALAATDETAEPTGDTPEIAGLKKEDERLLGSITAKRQLNRELDKKIATKLAAEEAAKPKEKSPYDKYLEENPEAIDEPFPAKIVIAQSKWEKEQDAKRQAERETSTISTRVNESYLKARQKYKDFDDILIGAEDVLTEGDQIDIRNAILRGEDGGELLYKRCIYKTLLAGGDRAKELRAKLQKKVTTKASVQKETKETGGLKKETVKVPAGEPAGAEKILSNPTLAHIYSAFGFEG